MIEWINSKTVEITDMVQGLGTLGAIAMVALSYIKTRALVPFLVASLLAGVFLWTIHNVTWWEQRVGEETGAAITTDEVNSQAAIAVMPWAMG